MAYRDDNDLNFLKNIKSKDMEDLVNILTHDKDGNVRFTEELTLNDRYKKYYPNHNKYWDLVAAEIQCFGANTFMTIFRGGKGVLYREVLTDVCDKMDVSYDDKQKIETIENNLLLKIINKAVEKMSPEEIKILFSEMDVKDTSIINSRKMISIFRTIFNIGGFNSYQITLRVVNSVSKTIFGRGLSLAANSGLTKTLGILAGPLGTTISTLWLAIDAAGPAYQVTTPAVLYVALLRKKYLYGEANKFSKQTFISKITSFFKKH